jgi:pimeloyl-ACP methyl ester carboxylesterase
LPETPALPLWLQAFAPREAAGPPLLFVHGVMHGAWCWEERFIPWFTDRGHACYTLELPGHGRDRDRFSHRLRLKAYRRRVLDALDLLPAPPVLVGHSLGGLLAREASLLRPLAGVVLLAPLPDGGIRAASWRTFRLGPLPFLIGLSHLDILRIFPDAGAMRRAMYGDILPEAPLKAWYLRLGPESIGAYLDLLAYRPRRPQADGPPMLLLSALRDRLVSGAENRRTAWGWQADLREFPHAAHNLMLDEGWESVAQAMHKWLQARGLNNRPAITDDAT